MTIKYSNKRSTLETTSARNRRSLITRIFIAAGLLLLLAINVISMAAISEPGNASNSQSLPTASSTLTFKAEADARVEEGNAAQNMGTSDYLEVIDASNRSVESYLRFTVSGISGEIQNARLRMYSTTDTSEDGPAVYAADNSWTEAGITWKNRPARLHGPNDNKDFIRSYTWVEYDVTGFLTGNGTYTFLLAGDSDDPVRFYSREGVNGPQLVITLGAGTPTPTLTPTPAPTFTPSPTLSDEVVMVGAGDIAACDREEDELTAQLLDDIPGTVFTTGDNAYVDGTYSDYMNCYDPSWGRHKSRTRPLPGNHEYNTSGAAGYFQYFNNISSYYAYTLGKWRIYALNSEIDVSASSPQVIWLKDDLAAHPSQCVLAYWHRPRWSSGSKNGSDENMQTLWQILYEAGAEVVITGHEHNYERFAEMDASGAAVSQGLRQIVVGTGGAGLYPFGAPLPASEVRDDTTFGVLKLTLHTNSYEWEFIPAAGSMFTDSGGGNCH